MQGITENSFIATLTAAVGDNDPPLTEEEVRLKAVQMAAILNFGGSVENAVHQALISIVTRMGQGVSIIDTTAQHDEEWVRKRNLTWTYSDAYERHLRQSGWSAQMVQALSDVSLRILGHLQDPSSDGAWDRRGLVIGHVQSGKTANYLSVVSRAADAGYKFIIVIAGIHNNLRKQTQERVDAGFIGRSSDPAQKHKKIGAGIFSETYPHPATLTNVLNDFNTRTANNSGWKINDFSKPIILVIKKNVSTLKALHGWLFELNAQRGQISDVPMLMIDDEADNASINTNKPDLDPTKTNEWIRKILGLFDKSCYVGYTATPFANIFINPDAYSEAARDELFPRDFIYSLDPPSSYFGPDKVFLEQSSSDRTLRIIADCEDLIPSSHTKDDTVEDLPGSLYEAIDDFLVGRAIRNLRGQAHMHCSMMINVSRFVDIQRQVRTLVASYIRHMQDAVLANYAVPGSESTSTYVKRLFESYEREFSACGESWQRVKAALPEVFTNLRTFVINSKSDESLDYTKYEEDGQSLTAIAVGGLSLSRGLTIEGLTVSYMHRNTSMYDTLMQMGRWFGYRPRYEDLCRVFLTQDSVDWYAHIAEKTEELRSQIRRMRRDGLTPRQFGLYVESHPDRLLITAANKMRHGKPMEFDKSLSGQLVETHIVPESTKINEANEQLITEFWISGFGGVVGQSDKGWWIQDADIEQVIQFLTRFDVLPGAMEIEKRAAITYLQDIAAEHPKADVVLISVAGTDEDASQHRLGYQRRWTSATKLEAEKAWRMSKDRVASRGDERIGLTPSQIGRAEQHALEDHIEDERRSGKPSDAHYREVRKKPLLMVHVLGLGTEAKILRAPAFGVSFPYGNDFRTVKVVVNKVWMDQMLGSINDNPDDEEDYDE